MTPFKKALKDYADAYERHAEALNNELRIQKEVSASRKNLLLAKEALKQAERDSLSY